MSTDILKFPSGRSVENCRKDAKRLAKIERIPLHEALDRIARTNGASNSWGREVAILNQPKTQPEVVSGWMTAADIQTVMNKWPLLNHFGFELNRISVREGESYHDKLKQNRGKLLSAVDECNRAVEFLRFIKHRKTINSKVGTSYGLKRQVERFCRAKPSVNAVDQYVANGSFICAALHLGFECKQSNRGSPNVYFNISSRSPIFEWQWLYGRVGLTTAERQHLKELEIELGIHS